MNEEELNIKYIRHKLGVDMLLAKEILKLCSERYIEGIEQGKFDRLMLEQENQQLKDNWNELKCILKEMYIHTQYTGYLDIIHKMEILDKVKE